MNEPNFPSSLECVRPLLRASDVARLLSVSARAVYRWAESGELASVRLSDRAVRFREEDVAEFVGASVSGR